MEIFTFGWQMLVILLLVVANGFFVAAEFAIVKIRATQLKPLLKSGDWRIPIAVKVTKHLDAYLSATQLGITLSSLGLGWLGEPFVSKWLHPLLMFAGITSEKTQHVISYMVAFSIITFLHIVLGELAPKSLAIRYPKQVTLWLSPVLLIFYYLFFPAIWFLNGAANKMLHMIGIPPASEGDHAFTQDELQYVLMHSSHVHAADELVNKIMLKALRLKETTAEQVMYPRDNVAVLWRDKPLEENFLLAQKAGYSRMPLCGASIDEVLGVIHVRELLWQHQLLGAQTDLKSIVRPILTFLPGTRLPAMLELFRKSRNHLAIVVDRDDKMLGIVSFEDVLEELVGDIRDEFDIEKGPIYERSENSVLVDGDLPVRDLASETGWSLPVQTTDTVEKWCLEKWGRRPAAGEELKVDGLRIIAEEVSVKRLRRIRFVREVPAVEGGHG
jgi:CBS domain containing-hemolysin-like protein